MGGLYQRFDGFQQRHGWLGFTLAVRQKYADDQGSYLAATVAYYGFFSIFPLLLVLTTVLAFVLHGHPHLQAQIVNSALGQFPVIGHDLKTHSLRGNVLALTLGIAGALWAGMGAVLAAENAMNQLWGVPFKRRPDFVRARARAVLLLFVFGGAALAATALAAAGKVGARAKAHPGVVRGFQLAIRQAGAYAKAHKGTIRNAITEYTSLKVADVGALHLEGYPATTDAKAIKRVADYMKNTGALATTFHVQNMIWPQPKPTAK